MSKLAISAGVASTPTSLIDTNANDKDTTAVLIAVYASETDSAAVYCKVVWGAEGTLSATAITQYIRSHTATPATQYVLEGKNAVITATFYGDVGTVAWTDNADAAFTDAR